MSTKVGSIHCKKLQKGNKNPSHSTSETNIELNARCRGHCDSSRGIESDYGSRGPKIEPLLGAGLFSLYLFMVCP